MPIRIPDFRLNVAGLDISPSIRGRLSGLTLTEARDTEADQLDLVLSDHDGALAIPPPGAIITVRIGWKGEALIDKGTFTVDDRGHEGAPDRLTIRASSADFTADFRIRRTAVMHQTTLGDVLRQVAARQGLHAAVSPALASIALPLLEQSRESDGALLKRLGERYDAVATVKAGRLLFTPVGGGVAPSSTAAPPVPLAGDVLIVRADGDNHRWRSTERDSAYTGVSASWRDIGQARVRTVTVGAPGSGSGKAKRLRRTYATEQHAREAASAEWGRVRRGAAECGFTLAHGRPDIGPERKVRLQGFKPEIDAALWLVRQAVHTLSETSFTTALELETAPA